MAGRRATAVGNGVRRAAVNPHALMVVATFIFGANYVVGRAVVGEVPPMMMGFTRWTGAALILLPFTWRYVNADWEEIRARWRPLTIAGILMPFMGAGVTYIALTKTIAINAGIVQISLPIFIVLLAWVFLGERLAIIQGVGAATAIAGVLAIVVRGDPAALLHLRFNDGDLILIVCNLSLAGYAVTIRRLPPGLHPMTLLTVLCAIGGAVHVPFLAAELAGGEAVRATVGAALGLLFVALFPSVISIMCWNHGIATLGANRAGFYMYLVPIFSAALAYFFLGETIAAYHLVGGALIVAGVTLSTRH